MDSRVDASIIMTVGPFLFVLAAVADGWRWLVDGGGGDEWSWWRQCVAVAAAAAAAAEEDDGSKDVWRNMCGGGYPNEWPWWRCQQQRRLVTKATVINVTKKINNQQLHRLRHCPVHIPAKESKITTTILGGWVTKKYNNEQQQKQQQLLLCYCYFAN
jgi:hypothetical protein